jgi:hypothetical protein
MEPPSPSPDEGRGATRSGHVCFDGESELGFCWMTMKAPIFDQLARRKKVAEILRDCLRPYGLQDEVDEMELQLGNVIVENTGNGNRISQAVLDTMFPRQQTPREFYHYTKMQGLRGIASSGELRLYALRNRIDEGELDTFAQKHRLKGYLGSSAGEPMFKELSDDIFYTSFCGLGSSGEQYMWGAFAAGGTGVRFKFRIEPLIPELEARSIQYEQAARTLLNDINDRLGKEGEPPFVPWTLSKIGAFYLPSSLAIEDEMRLLIKRHKGGRNDARTEGKYEFWPLPIGTRGDLCRLEVLEIQAGPNAVRADIEAAINGTLLATVPVSGP